MKRWKIILIIGIIISLFCTMITPVKHFIKDGGSIVYDSLCPGIYEVWDYNAFMKDDMRFVGKVIIIFGKTVYDNTYTVKIK